MGPEVLRDLNFQVMPKSFQFLTGPSGAGKTSLIRLVFLSLKPSRGAVQMFGRDVTNLEDPVESYHRFITRVIREYESLALVFQFITVDAEQSIIEQHRQIRRLFREGEQKPWSEWNVDAFAEWLAGRNARD